MLERVKNLNVLPMLRLFEIFSLQALFVVLSMSFFKSFV